MRDLAVGLSSDCDNPESDVAKLMREHLKNARTLPFVGFVTHDGKWVAGFSGYKDAGAFLNEIEKAEKTPHLQASAATRQKIAKMVTTAAKAADKGQWKVAVKAGQTVAKMWGRCPERTQISALVAKARAWANTTFDEAIKSARAGEDLKEAKKAIAGVRSNFAKEPEADEAATGLKALSKLASVRKIEAKGRSREGLREKAAKPFEGTRWTKLFEAGE